MSASFILNHNALVLISVKNNPFSALLLIIAVFIMYACAGMGSMIGENVRIYHERIDKMVEISRKAVQNKGESVASIQQRREESRRTTIIFVNRTTAAAQSTQMAPWK